MVAKRVAEYGTNDLQCSGYGQPEDSAQKAKSRIALGDIDRRSAATTIPITRRDGPSAAADYTPA